MLQPDFYNVPVFGITGWKNSGKTLLTTRLIEEFTRLGLKVGAIKHAHHSFEIDHEGRDSYRMRDAGARQVAVVSRFRWALLCELEPEPEPSFEDLLEHFEGFDLVLVEGYKELAFPKIEARSDLQETKQMLAVGRDDIIAIASAGKTSTGDLPCFDPDNITEIGEFILQVLKIKNSSHT